MDIYLSAPVNKTAALVTNQSGCTDTFLLPYHEQKRMLGIRKNELSKKIKDIKIEMGANRQVHNNKQPRFMLKHPRQKELIRLVNEVNNIEKEILELKEKTREQGKKYTEFFFHIMKEKYPRQYEVVKREAIKQCEQDT